MRSESSALPQSRKRGHEKKILGGVILFHPRPKPPRLPYKWKTKKGDTKKKFPGRKCLRKIWKPVSTRGSPPLPGTERAVPGRAPFHAPRLSSWTAAPLHSPGTPRVAVWGGRDVVARPRGIGWRPGEPVPRGAY